MIDQIHFNLRLMLGFMVLEEQAVKGHRWQVHTRILFASAGSVGHAHLLLSTYGVTGRNPRQGAIITLGASSASVPSLRGGFN